MDNSEKWDDFEKSKISRIRKIAKDWTFPGKKMSIPYPREKNCS